MLKSLLKFFRRKNEANILKQTFLINDRRITIIIELEDLNSFNKFLQDSYSRLVSSRKELKYILDFHQNKFIKIAVDLILNSFVAVFNEYLSVINTKELTIHIKIDETKGCGRFVEEISSESDAFFEIDYWYLTAKTYKIYSEGQAISKLINSISTKLSRLERQIKSLLIVDEQSYVEFVRHEFTHYLDLTAIRKRSAIVSKIQENTGREKSEPIWLLKRIYDFRTEGLARFNEYKNKGFFVYDCKEVRDVKLFISYFIEDNEHYFTKNGSKGFAYTCGFYMCYFIGLAELFLSDRKVFNEMRVLYSGNNNFLFYTEGMMRVLNYADELGLNRIQLQNFSLAFSKKIMVQITSWSHLKFIKEYEKACEVLDIPKKHIILTLEDYNKLKFQAYKLWIEDVEKYGFDATFLEKYLEKRKG